MGFARRKAEAPRVELTAMIDVVFLLLVFFMISTTFVEQSGLEIDLPDSSQGVVEQEPQQLQVYLTHSGEIYLDRQQVSLAELSEQLFLYAANRGGEGAFVLMADKDVSHGQVMELMDLARRAGIAQLAIATDKSDPDRTPSAPAAAHSE